MKILLTGAKGQVGYEISGLGRDIGFDIIETDYPELNIVSPTSITEKLKLHNPDIVVNSAAYTAVEKAESEIQLAFAVNREGSQHLAEACVVFNIPLIHISTDFVFDGQSSTPYKADAVTNPLSVYGQTKRDGELAVLEETSGTAVVIRTSWLYSKTGSNFGKTMLRLMGERDELGIVADQFGSPTWADSLAEALWAFVDAPEHSGIFHWTDSGETSWQEFAVAIQQEALALGLLGKAIPIHAIKTEDYSTVATRPAYSVLDCSSTIQAINIQPAEWRTNLRRMLKGMTE